MRRRLAVAGAAVAGLLFTAASPAEPGQPFGFRLSRGLDKARYDTTTIHWLRDGRGAGQLRIRDSIYSSVVGHHGRFVVLGGDRLRFVDLVSRRLAFAAPIPFGTVDAGCLIEPLVWTESDRIIAYVWCGWTHGSFYARLLTYDLHRRRVVVSRRIGYQRSGPVRGPDGSVALLVSPPLVPVNRKYAIPPETIGAARLIRIDADGTTHVVRLRIRMGNNNARTFGRSPGFTADERGHAYVVAEGDGAAEIDLRTLRVRYHRLRHAFDARPRKLAPAPVPHEGTNNPSRDLSRVAVWLGDNLVAVSGWDSWTDGQTDQDLEAGLKVLDVRTWRVRSVDPSIRELRFTHRFMLGTGRHAGLRVFDRHGRPVRRYFPGRWVWISGVLGDRVRASVPWGYVSRDFKGVAPTRIYDIKLDTGRVRLVRRYGGG